MTPSNPKPGEGHTPTPDLKSCMSAGSKGAFIYETAHHASPKMVEIRNLLGELPNAHFDAVVIAVKQHARLLASNEEMREALEPFAGIAVEYWPMGKEYADISMKRSLILAARAALARHPDKEDAP